MDIKNNELRKAEQILKREFKKLKQKLFKIEDGIVALSKIYAFIDACWCDFFKKHSACKAGCSYCCKMNIELTPLEAKYISSKAGYPVNLNANFRLSKDGVHKPCPFLDADGYCMIYEYRPLFCRLHFAFTEPCMCDITKNRPAQTVDLKRDEVIVELSRIITQMNGDDSMPYYSIHSYFPFKNTYGCDLSN